jgi:hypothetical protein
MYYNGAKVTRVYTTHDGQNCWAIFSGGGAPGGWKRIRPNAADGVTNVHLALTAALASSRTVDVYIKDDQVERVVVR